MISCRGNYNYYARLLTRPASHLGQVKKMLFNSKPPHATRVQETINNLKHEDKAKRQLLAFTQASKSKVRVGLVLPLMKSDADMQISLGRSHFYYHARWSY